MRALLDTHVLLWWLTDDARLGTDSRRFIADTSNEVLVSSVSAFEIAMKQSLGKLTVPAGFRDLLPGFGFSELPMSIAHGLEVGNLPWHHRDPFDRLLIAQSRLEDIPLISFDTAFEPYDYPRLT